MICMITRTLEFMKLACALSRDGYFRVAGVSAFELVRGCSCTSHPCGEHSTLN